MFLLSHLFTFPNWRHSKHDVTTLSQVPLLALAKNYLATRCQEKNQVFNGGRKLRYKAGVCAWTECQRRPFTKSPNKKVQKKVQKFKIGGGTWQWPSLAWTLVSQASHQSSKNLKMSRDWAWAGPEWCVRPPFKVESPKIPKNGGCHVEKANH